MKTLIAYFSWSNNTKRLVETINKDFNFDVVRIQRATPYSDDYNQCAYIEAKEEVVNHIYPDIKNIDIDFDKFDNILLFVPIWWYTVPMPVLTFIKKLTNYKGKVILFANSYTNDPQYMSNCRKDILKINPNLHLENGLFNKSIKEHISFLKGEQI